MMRDLPMPGSPDSSTTWPSPSLAWRQRDSSRRTSSSRPTRGVRPARRGGLEARGAGRLAHPVDRHRRAHAPDRQRRRGRRRGTGPRSAGRCWRRPRRCRAPPAPAGGRRRSGVSPTTAISSRLSPVPMSPTTTSPVLMPIRIASSMPGCGTRGVQRGDRLDHAEPGADRPLGVVLMRPRIAEIRQDAVADVVADMAAIAADHLDAGIPGSAA